MRSYVTTALDVLGLLTVAGGVYFLAQQWIGHAGLVPAGLVVLGVSAWWGTRGHSEDGRQ